MAGDAEPHAQTNWLSSCSFVQVFRTFRLAIHPTKLALTFAAIVLTLAWGSLLDAVWRAADHGVTEHAVIQHLQGAEAAWSEDSAERDHGVFSVWRDFEINCLESALLSARHGRFWSTGIEQQVLALQLLPERAGREVVPVATPTGVTGSLLLAAQGCRWLVTQQPSYALLFLLGTLAIWSLLGGAVCRVAAVQFARGEKIGWRDAVGYARERFLTGFFTAPLLPILLVAVIGIFLALGGAFLRIPYVGDLLGGLLFVLALCGGAVLAMVVVGSVAGGSLFWPTIAVEGSESLDAVSRGFNYVWVTPWRALLYGLVALVYGSLCFLFVKIMAFVALAGTHLFVGWGTSPFGWWAYDGEMSKLDLIWQAPTFANWHGGTLAVSGVERLSAGLVAFWVLVVIMLVWAFLASFYLCASTVVYYLLRRDNDAMDLEDVYIEDYEEGDYPPDQTDAPPPDKVEPAGQQTVPLTVKGQPAAPKAEDESDDEKAASPEEPDTES